MCWFKVFPRDANSIGPARSYEGMHSHGAVRATQDAPARAVQAAMWSSRRIRAVVLAHESRDRSR